MGDIGFTGLVRPNPFAREHIRHHVEGDYFAPGWKKLAAALLIFVLVAGPATFLAGFWLGVAYVGGLVGFYLFYEILHRLEHTSAGFGSYGRWVRRHHFYHHFVDARFNHGVTLPIWDFVFGTYRKPGVIPVPPRLMMSWLGDPETGIKPELAGTYEVKRVGRLREHPELPPSPS